MANDLIPTQAELFAIQEISKQAVESKYVEKLGGFAAVFSIAMYAREIGVPVMSALFGGMSNIMGKITIAPQLMNAMIRRAGHTLRIDSNDLRCIIEGVRKDTGETCTASFSVEEAKKAGLVKPNGGWEKYPSDMCFARALSRLARRLFPDVIGMAYVEGEIEETKANLPPKEEPKKPKEEEVKVIEISTETLLGPDQVAKIQEMIGENVTYLNNLLKFYKVDSIAKIPQNKWPKLYEAVTKHVELTKPAPINEAAK